MIKNVTDSKKSVITWLVVTGVLFVGIPLLLYLLLRSSIEPEDSRWLIFAVLIGFGYVFANFPIGFCIRRQYLKWYAHVPTENMKIFDPDVLGAVFRAIKCEFFIALNFCLFVLYMIASFICGIILGPYAIISGIVFLIQGKYTF